MICAPSRPSSASEGSATSPSKRSRRSSGWTIEFRPNARNELRKLDRSVQRRLVNYLEQRVVARGDPRRWGKALHGEKGEFWSYRVGNYRIISLIEDRRLVIVVVSVGHRRHVYR
ncbi:MAG: type II toxin-antitoxin system RelE family toxin [Geminicoccaceae bacterium]